jgi:hypothetical protein
MQERLEANDVLTNSVLLRSFYSCGFVDSEVSVIMEDLQDLYSRPLRLAP